MQPLTAPFHEKECNSLLKHFCNTSILYQSREVNEAQKDNIPFSIEIEKCQIFMFWSN